MNEITITATLNEELESEDYEKIMEFLMELGMSDIRFEENKQ